MKRAELIEMRDNLIKNIEKDILEDYKTDDDFDYNTSYSCNLIANIKYKKHRNWTFDEARDILFLYFEIDIVDNDKEYNLFELISQVYDDCDEDKEFDYLMRGSLDGFIYNAFEKQMWKKNFKDREESFLKLNHHL